MLHHFGALTLAIYRALRDRICAACQGGPATRPDLVDPAWRPQNRAIAVKELERNAAQKSESPLWVGDSRGLSSRESGAIRPSPLRLAG